MTDANFVEKLKREIDDVIIALGKASEVSAVNNLNNHFRKVLILAAGSFFENEITELFRKFSRHVSRGDQRLEEFLIRQAIKKKYHTLFDWGKDDKPNEPGKNANKFFSLFGEEFKKARGNDITQSDELNNSIQAFIEIGHARNILAHSEADVANRVFENKTFDDIIDLFRKAKCFLAYLQEVLLNENSEEKPVE